ncbi:glycosyltransferase [Catellatospora chokoriensis]|uniref:glycosyltransferase n=1 Tax=Catellatospora chokoriensis TaxID=310353 RepID=UPI0017854AD1|nr:glycosyltransferase [Catellatospora chokoriensis]
MTPGAKVDERPLVVIFGANPWDDVLMNDRLLAIELLRYCDILWVDPHLSVLSPRAKERGRLRSLWPETEKVQEGLTLLRPVALPAHSRAGLRHTTAPLLRSQTRRALLTMGRTPYAVIDARFGRMTGGWGPGVLNVMYAMDDVVGGAYLMGRDVGAVLTDERETLARADLVLAVSEPLADRLRGLGGQARLLANGVAVEMYRDVDGAPPAPEVDLPHPIAGIIGYLSERIDIALLEAIVEAGMSLLMVGKHDPRFEPARFARLAEHPRVQYVGLQPFAKLSSYLHHIDVGVTPYVDSEFNRASCPLKTLEYLAAGRPAVSTDLPAARWLGTDLIRIASEPAAFAAAVRDVSAESREPYYMAARRAFAANHSWRRRGDDLAEMLGLVPAAHRSDESEGVRPA